MDIDDSMQKSIFVEIEEGAGEPVFAPVIGKLLVDKYYQITALSEDLQESARFKQGDYVYCLDVVFSNQTKLLAYKLVSEEMVKYFRNTVKEI